jgi:hypothetical protein
VGFVPSGYAGAFCAIMAAFVVATLLVPLLHKVAATNASSSDAH